MDETARAEARLALVRSIIHAWDPYGLIAGGCPDDEWDLEIAGLMERLPSIASADDAIRAISEVFSQSLIPEHFPPDRCTKVGLKLFDALAAEGL